MTFPFGFSDQVVGYHYGINDFGYIYGYLFALIVRTFGLFFVMKWDRDDIIYVTIAIVVDNIISNGMTKGDGYFAITAVF